MKLSKMFLMVALVSAMATLGCSDDSGSGGTAGSGGTGGTGGTAGETGGGGDTGGGGTGGEFDFDTACDRELCLESDVLKMECEELVATCRTEPPANQDECILIINEKCDGG